MVAVGRVGHIPCTSQTGRHLESARLRAWSTRKPGRAENSNHVMRSRVAASKASNAIGPTGRVLKLNCGGG